MPPGDTLSYCVGKDQAHSRYYDRCADESTGIAFLPSLYLLLPNTEIDISQAPAPEVRTYAIKVAVLVASTVEQPFGGGRLMGAYWYNVLYDSILY